MLKVAGFTLIEFLIASCLSIFILMGFIRIYLSIKLNYTWQQELSRMQEAGRFASNLFENEIHSLGYIGCPLFNDQFFKTKFSNNTHLSFNPKSIIKATHNNQLDSDEISFQQTQFTGEHLVQDVTEKNQVIVNKEHLFKVNDIILMSDCIHAEMAVVEHATLHQKSQTLQLNKPLSYGFKKNTEVGLLRQKRFFVQSTGRKTNQGITLFSLFVDENEKTEELVPDVSRIKIYVERNANGSFSFVSANEVTDWSKIIAIKIVFLIESEADITNKSSSYFFDDKVFQSSDQRLRFQWPMLATLRNRALL